MMVLVWRKPALTSLLMLTFLLAPSNQTSATSSSITASPSTNNTPSSGHNELPKTTLEQSPSDNSSNSQAVTSQRASKTSSTGPLQNTGPTLGLSTSPRNLSRPSDPMTSSPARLRRDSESADQLSPGLTQAPNTLPLPDDPCQDWIPDQVSDIQGQFEGNNVVFSWHPPGFEHDPSCELTYNVELPQLNISVQTITSPNVTVPHDDYKCFNVKITVTAVGPGKYGQPKSEQLVIKSEDWTPGRVHNIKGELQDGSVTFSWEHTLDNDTLGCNPTYTVDLPGQLNWHSNQSITDTSLTVSFNSYKCLNANISVTPVGPGSLRKGQTTTEQLFIKSADWKLGQVSNITGTLYYGYMMLEWIRPVSNHTIGCVPTSYIVNVQQGSNNREENETINTYWRLPSADQTCLKIDITVTAMMQVGQQPELGTPTSQLLYNGSGVPGAVSLSTYEFNDTYIKISFKPPSRNPTCVDLYNVTYRAQRFNSTDVNLTVLANQHYVELTSLEPCTTYQAEVKPFWINTTFGNDVPWQISTESIIPGAPTNLMINNITDSQVEATWQPDSKSQYCVVNYHVSLLLGNQTVYSENTTLPNVTISHLFSCTIYQLAVAARGTNHELRSDYTDTEFKTASRAPPSPLDGTVRNKGPRHVEMKWMLANLTDTRNGCLLDNFEMMCNKIGSKVQHKYDAKLERTSSSVIGTVRQLQPNTHYNCTARVNNIAGWSTTSAPVQVTTKETAPEAPVNLKIVNVTESTISITWQPPVTELGKIIRYWVHINCTPDHQVKTGCEATQRCTNRSTKYEVDHQALQYEIVNATSGNDYVIQVSGESEVGLGDLSKPAAASTLPIGATLVNNLTAAETVLTNSVSVDLSWEQPCQLYSHLTYYKIDVIGKRNEQSFGPMIHQINVTKYQLMDLKSDVNYTVTVKAVTNNGTLEGQHATHKFTTTAGVPPEPGANANRSVSCTSNSSTEAYVKLEKELFSEDMGLIREWFLLIATKGSLNSTYGTGSLPPVGTWAQTEAGTKGIYQATPRHWRPFDHDETSTIFILGSDSNCEKGGEGICNGPLIPSTEYSVMVRAATTAGFRDFKPIDFRTDSSSAGLIAFCVLFLILAISVGMVLFMMKRKNTSWPRKLMVTLFGVAEEQSASTSAAHTRHTNIVADKFSAYCSDLMADNNSGETKLTEEFKLLASLSPPSLAIQPSAYSVALIPDNRFKNRYVNILPYDETRVEISMIDNDLTSNYVNASFIKGYSGEVEYIASQGPKSDTSEDFWRMVFEHDVTVIAMVTGLVEKGKEKCYQYYPNLRETSDFGYVSVKSVSEVNFPIYTTRTLLVQMVMTIVYPLDHQVNNDCNLQNTMQKTVIHLHFREWPDFGCPATTDLMLSFSQTMRQQVVENEGLVLVHCSAGVGRTGTLISMDILLQQLQEYRKVDVFNTVLKLRQQRVNMVQTESQYGYIHKCLIDAIDDPSLLNSGESTADSTEPIYQNTELIYQNTELIHQNIEGPMDREMDMYPVLVPDIEEVDTESAM